MSDETIESENANTPGRTEQMNRDKYLPMRVAFMTVLPAEPPGVLEADAKQAWYRPGPTIFSPAGYKSRSSATGHITSVDCDLELAAEMGGKIR